MSNMTPHSREVLTQVEPVDSVRLLTWFFSSNEQSWFGSPMLHGWSAGCCHATKGVSFCWQHHSRTQELSSLSACGFSCANKQPSTLGSYSASCSSSPCLTSRLLALQLSSHPLHSSLAPNPRSMIIPQTVHLMANVTRGLTSESRKSPLMMVAMDPMSMPDQLLWLPSLIPLPLKVAESESLLLILGMQSMTNMTPLTNTAMSAVGTVFNMSSPSLAMEFSPKPGAVKQHQQIATVPASPSPLIPQSSQGSTLTLMMLWLWRTLGVHGDGDGDFIMGVSEDDTDQDDDESDSETDLWRKCHWLQSWVSNWGWLPHMLRHQRCSSKVCP